MTDKTEDKKELDPIAEASHIDASRDELVAEEHLEQEPVISPPSDEDEIDSVRENILREQEAEADYEGDEEEEAEDTTSNSPYYERMILKAAGAKGTKYDNLRTKLTGKIALAVRENARASASNGFTIEWVGTELAVEKWSAKKAPKAKTTVTITKRDLESLLRGKLNPQIAMLSHKVSVVGEVGQAVYFLICSEILRLTIQDCYL